MNNDTTIVVVDADTPPPLECMAKCVHGFERSKSPWHADAFPDEFKRSAPEQGERKSGWMALDWCGNLIGFIADGSSFNLKSDQTSIDDVAGGSHNAQ